MHVKRTWRQARERGDTIVEVLISVAVVSLILGGAYVVSNTSLQQTEAAQERGNALKLGESQIEQLKGVIATNPQAVFGPGAPASFCIASTTTVVDTTGPSSNLCSVDVSGIPTPPANRKPIFTLAIRRTGQLFALKETWTDVDGRTTDNLQLTYRAYQ
ncbi:MAG TPA: hypothetical protein VKQ34_05200 [Candidatus Saccharimonadales bacterium]|nr:hypothetical protein [Candidatus Saccharimonadales bacterium]